MKTKLPWVPFFKPLKGAFEFDLLSLDYLFQEGKDLPIYPHKIEFYQILLIIHGEGSHTIDFKNYEYHKGTLLSVAKNQAQVFKFSKGVDGYVIVFTDQFLYKYKTDLELFSNLTLFNNYISDPVLHLEQKDLKDLLEVVVQMEKELVFDPDPGTEEIIRSLLKVFILKAERIKGKNTKIQKLDSNYEIFLKFKNDLDENFAFTRQVSDYCEKIHVSYRKLSRVLKDYVDKTPKEFIDERVVLEVKRLLIHTSMSIKEIAYTVGFNDPTNLTKFFKLYANCTPSEFRD